MSKKKSYMDRKNILSEGMIGNFLYNLLNTITKFSSDMQLLNKISSFSYIS